MNRQKSYFFNYFLWKNIFLISTSLCSVFLVLNFNSNPVSAAYIPTLSASVNNMNLQINGNQVINSASQTKEIPLSLTVNTNNKTGYTITLNSETDENALVNANSATNAKIDSISASSSLNNFSNNTWGVKFGTNANFSPIPKLTAPTNIAQTTTKTNGNEISNINLGLKLGNNLESGSYKNKLIFSILTNRYDSIAKMTTGYDFNEKLKSLETTTNKIEHFKKSTTAPAVTMNAINIEAPESDCEIKLWLNPTDKTAYYYAEPEKVYLNEDSSEMFYYRPFPEGIKDIKDLDLSNFDTSNVTDMSIMFANMFSLTSLNLSNFDTSKVTDMSVMFNNMHSLTSLNLSNFDTSKVTDMNYMFAGVSKLTSLNLSNFDTYNVTNMRAMFYNMSKLTSLDLSNFNTSKVTNMSYMFYNMSSLTSLNLSNFDTSKVTDMNYMFACVSKLTSLNLSNFDTSNVTNMNGMFTYMDSLTSLDLSNFNTSKVTNMSYMFSLLDIYTPDDKLEKIYVNNDFDTSKLVEFSYMFKHRKKFRGGAGSFLSDPSTADKSWLRIDDPAHGRPGYFTKKP